MEAATNAGNIRQYKSRFSLIVEPVMGVALSINLLREVKNLSLRSCKLYNNVSRYR